MAQKGMNEPEIDRPRQDASHRRVWLIWGEKPNSRSMVANRRRELVSWLRNRLTEQATHSIYSVCKRWLQIWERQASDRSKDESPELLIMAFTGQRVYGCWGPSASEGPQKQDLTVFL
jgi:hypothetical protein